MLIVWLCSAAVVACGFLIIYIWATWNNNYWYKLGIPFIKPAFLFGNLKDYVLFRKNIGEVYNELYWKFPDEPAVGVFKLRSPQLMLRDIDLIKTVCNKEFNSFRNHELKLNSEFNEVAASNPFLATGEKWKRLRNLHAAILSTGKLRLVYPYMLNVCKLMVDYLEQQENQDLEAKSLAMLYSTDILARCLFSMKINSFINTSQEIHKVVVAYFNRRTFFNASLMFLSLIPCPNYLLRFRHSTKGATDCLTKIIKDLFENPTDDNSLPKNLVQLMAHESLSSAYKSTYEELANHSMTYFSGFDSTSTEIALTLYMLALHPEVQNDLRNEIKEVGEIGLGFDRLHKMKYLEAVINETMRLYPTCLVSRRECTQDIVLKSGVRHYPIKKGMTVSIPYYAIHRDEAYYPDPMKFNPDRFYEKETLSQFLPFGIGPRICFGAKFSLTAIKCAVFHIVDNFEILLSQNVEPKMPEFCINSLIPIPRDKLWINLRKLK
ncbi:probable cytochrome P450 28d1 [Rhodnius prolixus]|uniref:probable cytochrome P450 28d1 n=1 Tax=Rhodnius prolixus TaxID=13249 RepID=UPI003D18B2CB